MKQRLLFFFVMIFLLSISIISQTTKPALAKIKMETKDYHGVKIDDPYSYMQNFDEPGSAKLGKEPSRVWKEIFLIIFLREIK